MPNSSAASTGGRVLVTDGEFKHTLGIVRALAEHGRRVHVVVRSQRAPAAHSRAVHGVHELEPGAGFASALSDLAQRLAPVSLIPVGSGSVAAAHAMRDRFAAGVACALPPGAAYETAMDKHRTAERARSLGIATPREFELKDASAAHVAWRELRPLMVIKSAREQGVKAVRYVRAEDDVTPAYEEILELSGGPVLAQEYVAGEGFGFSALYWHGRRMRSFMHRRVREWPPSGGTSAAAASIPECAPLERAGTALLDALEWHGVAMVEFKGDPASRLVLMEVNAKFWGSHDLALAAGVCFPADLATLLEGGTLAAQPPVRDVRFAWPFGGDLWHGLFHPRALPQVLWDAVSPAVARNWRWSDPLPHAYEIAQWVRSSPGALREFRDLS